MIKDINNSISTNSNTFLSESQENLNDSLFSNNSNIIEIEYNYLNEPIFPLLEEISRNSKDNIAYIPGSEFSSNKRIFLVKRKDERKIINKKRGRPGKNKSKTKTHDSTQVDNLITKIQTNFFNFVINFCNDALKAEDKYSKDFFKNINKNNKINVKYSYTSNLKKLSIKDLLKMDISAKNKKSKPSYNRDLLEKIENSCQSLNELFEMNYLELFIKHYNNGNPLNEIVYKNKTINLSKKTKLKSFYNLLEKKRNKNLKIFLIDIAKKEYINKEKPSIKSVSMKAT